MFMDIITDAFAAREAEAAKEKFRSYVIICGQGL
jgi:hypothetical protein